MDSHGPAALAGTRAYFSAWGSQRVSAGKSCRLVDMRGAGRKPPSVTTEAAKEQR